jgi:hypothetical protein
MSPAKKTTAPAKRAKKTKKPARKRTMSPAKIAGSREAKQRAAAILEVLCGVRTTAEGAAALGVQVTRYYVLEARALGAMVAALEPRPRGPRRSIECELRDVQRERDRLAGEVARLSALLRAAERMVGLPKKGQIQVKRRRTEPRGARVVRALRPGGNGAPQETSR